MRSSIPIKSESGPKDKRQNIQVCLTRRLRDPGSSEKNVAVSSTSIPSSIVIPPKTGSPPTPETGALLDPRNCGGDAVFENRGGDGVLAFDFIPHTPLLPWLELGAGETVPVMNMEVSKLEQYSHYTLFLITYATRLISTYRCYQITIAKY